jgi:hypothetical protein
MVNSVVENGGSFAVEMNTGNLTILTKATLDNDVHVDVAHEHIPHEDNFRVSFTGEGVSWPLPFDFAEAVQKLKDLLKHRHLPKSRYQGWFMYNWKTYTFGTVPEMHKKLVQLFVDNNYFEDN